MPAPKILAASLETFLILFILSVSHRLLTFTYLAGDLHACSGDGLRAVLVGMLSDWWVAYLGAALILVGTSVLALLGWPNGARLFQSLCLGTVAWAAALHVAYVRYFHFQIIPFHLRYLNDLAFIRANSSSLLTADVATSLAALPIVWFMFMRLDLFGLWRLARLWRWHATLLALSLVCHNRNIHYRVQWFIPENLQTNALERLYMHSVTAHLPIPLDGDEHRELAHILQAPAPPPGTPRAKDLLALITKPVPAAAGPAGLALRRVWQEAVATQQKPLILTVLLESLRPSETGYFAPAAGPSLTPHLDALAANGIAFMRAFSTGTVTRGAQEAAFCGYLGSRDASLMRGEVSASFVCLPDLLAQGTGSLHGDTFWLHGGDARFDGQVDFWRSHGVKAFMSQRDFPATTPRSNWGIGDKAFMRAVPLRLKALRASSQADFLVGIGLSVTNHVPWDLPSDAGPEVQQARAAGHPSYKTTAYTDAALSELVDGLQRQGLWDNTLLILASDHGTNLPPLVDLYQGQKNHDQKLASHINLILTGGLTSKALKSMGRQGLESSQLVSQAGIAALVASLLPLPEARFMAVDPLAVDHPLPVLSDLEQDLIDHGTGRVFTHQQLSSKEATSPEERPTLLYYRAFLEYIYSPP